MLFPVTLNNAILHHHFAVIVEILTVSRLFDASGGSCQQGLFNFVDGGCFITSCIDIRFHGHRKFCIAYFRRFLAELRFGIRIIAERSREDSLVSVLSTNVLSSACFR